MSLPLPDVEYAPRPPRPMPVADWLKLGQAFKRSLLERFPLAQVQVESDGPGGQPIIHAGGRSTDHAVFAVALEVCGRELADASEMVSPIRYGTDSWVHISFQPFPEIQ